MNTQVNLQEVENARQAWLESRRLGVGGSDVAAILGLPNINPLISYGLIKPIVRHSMTLKANRLTGVINLKISLLMNMQNEMA